MGSGVEGDGVLDFPGGHLGVGFGFAEACGLAFSGLEDALADFGGWRPGGSGGELLGFESGDGDVEVDPVEEGAGDFRGVAEAGVGADALGFVVSFVSAGAGVHGSDEDAIGGEGEGFFDSGDGDDAVFEGLAEGFEDVSGELGHFVEEEDAVVGEGDFSGLGGFSSADDGGVGSRVVG